MIVRLPVSTFWQFLRSKKLPVFRWAAFFILFGLLFQPWQTAHAHPLDMYSQNLSVTIAADGLHIDWKILPGPLLADAVWGAADQNQDGAVSLQEGEAWVSPFLSKMQISIDGQLLDKVTISEIHWPAKVDVLRTGEDPIDIQMLAKWPGALAGVQQVEVYPAYLESNSLYWFSITGQDGLSFAQPKQNSGRLDLSVYPPNGNSAASGTSVPLLTNWNSGIPTLPGFSGVVSSAAAGLTNQAQPQTPSGALTSVTDALVGLVKTQEFSPLFLLGAFLLSLALGSLHALTPGHGKALVAAYLVGSQGRPRDAVFLGLVVTLTHTGSVLLLGLLTLVASHYILPTLITPWLEIASGLLVIGFGLKLLFQRRRDLLSWRTSQKKESTSVAVGPTLKILPQTAMPLGAGRSMGPLSPHERDHAHPHSHADEHMHSHAHGEHGHSHNLPAGEVTWKSLLALGVSGGLVPCPDAIAILLVAVAINRIPFGMLLIVAFSIGLAMVLIGIGLAMVQGVRMIARSDLLTRFSMYTPIASAVIVSGLGIALTVSAFNTLNLSKVIAGGTSSAQVTVPVPAFDVQQARLLYMAPDSAANDQLFRLSLSGGTPIQLTHEPSGISGYSVSPDKKTVLYTVFDNGDSSIWAIQPDGGGKRLVLNCPQSQCNSPEWYPDSQKFVYARLDHPQNTSLSRFSLWWLDLSTGKSSPIFQDQAFPSFAPKFSPDGQWLSYISPANTTIQIYHLSDGRSLSISLGSQSTTPEVWSPSGDSLLFWDPVSSQDGAPLHVKRYFLDSGKIIDLGGSDNQADYTAVWSPDGKWIAVDRDIPATTGGTPQQGDQVWLVKPDGSQSHVLLDEANVSYSDLSWSPDGRYLVYSRYSYQDVGHPAIGMVDIQSNQRSTLVDSGTSPELLP